MKRQWLVGLGSIWVMVGAGCAEPTAVELMAMAHEARNAGEHRTAEIHLRNLLRQEPSSGEARHLLGQVALEQGDPAAAEAALRRALELGEPAQNVHLPLMQALVAQGKFAEALQQWASGPQLLGEDRVTGFRIAAAAHRGLNQVDSAEQLLYSALELDPDSLAVRTDLAELMITSNRPDEARRVIVDVLTDDRAYSPALVLRGALEMAAGRFDDAEASLRTVVTQEQPGNTAYFAALSRLVEVLNMKGEEEEAAQLAEGLLAVYPNHPIAIVLAADSEIRRGDLAPARRRLETLLSAAPRFGPANRLLGMINARQGQAQQAQMYLQNAVTYGGGDPRAVLHLAVVRLEQNDSNAALNALRGAQAAQQTTTDAALFALAARAALQLRERALVEPLLEQASASLTGDPQELLMVAAVYGEAGMNDRAQALLKTSSEEEADTAWMAALGLAMSQLQERKLEEADATADRLLQMQPQAAWPHNLKAMIAVARTDLDSADRHLETALRLDPEHVAALLNRARLRVIQRRPNDAKEDFRRVVALVPGNEAALVGLVELAIQERNFGEAKQWLEQAPARAQRLRLNATVAALENRFDEAADLFLELFEMRPTADHALQAYVLATRASRANAREPLEAWLAEHPYDVRVNFALGAADTQAGDSASAIAHFEAVVAVEPDHAEALNNLAWLYGETGDARAVATAERAYELAPENPAVADTLGWLYVQNRQAARGLPLLEQSHAAAPQYADIHYHLAVALAETGARARAVEELRGLLAGHATFGDRDAAERLLRTLE